MLSNNNNIKYDKTNLFVGEGSYGCIFKPGLDCKGNKNNNKNIINKIQLINFYSDNELNISNKIKELPNYETRFSPTINYCIIEFDKLYNNPNMDIKKCSILSQINTENNFINNKFYMFYIKYVYGKINIYDYFIEILNDKLEFNKTYLHSIYYLFNSVYLLNINNIVHNDLDNYKNILYNTKTYKPIIIDFGITYDINSLYIDDDFNFKIMKNVFFHYRNDKYLLSKIIEQNFVSFIFFNREKDYYGNINKKTLNILEKKDIILFTNNYFNIFKHMYRIHSFFIDNEYDIYIKAYETFYYKFLDKNKYYYFYDIINELLISIFKYTDIYFLSITFFYILYNYVKYDNYKNEENNNSNKENDIKKNKHHITFNYTKEPILYLLMQLFKKIIFPLPQYRINSKQFISIIEFIIKYINSISLDTIDKDIENFNEEFILLLNVLNINTDLFFYKEYAYIDFDIIFTIQNIEFIKSLNIIFK